MFDRFNGWLNKATFGIIVVILVSIGLMLLLSCTHFMNVFYLSLQIRCLKKTFKKCIESMSLFVVDVESDGQIIGVHSMVCFGVVKVCPELNVTFYGKTKPISSTYNPDALAVSGISREEHEKFDEPFIVMDNFAKWLEENNNGKPILISDNNGYDASWINYYFHVYHHGKIRSVGLPDELAIYFAVRNTICFILGKNIE
jgi:hypothetical protein